MPPHQGMSMYFSFLLILIFTSNKYIIQVKNIMCIIMQTGNNNYKPFIIYYVENLN